MDHLLRATSIGIIFLDHELNVRRFTPMAAGIFNIVPQDLGRPISHITYQFDEPNLLDLILGVKNTGKVHEQEIQNDDAPIMLRILPDTNTLENEVGVVITLIDISELKAIQNQQIREAKRHEEVFADIEERVIRWCRDTHSISYVNPAYAQSLQSTPKHMLGQDMVQIHESVHADEKRVATRRLKRASRRVARL